MQSIIIKNIIINFQRIFSSLIIYKLYFSIIEMRIIVNVHDSVFLDNHFHWGQNQTEKVLADKYVFYSSS